MRNLKKILIMLAMIVAGTFKSRADAFYTVNPSNIMQVIATCNDSMNNQVTLYMTPGQYQPLRIRNREHYINLIGSDNVTVKSESGLYNDPAAELRLNGTVRNITFISTHRKGVANTMDKGAYAVHLDYGSQHTVFKNCKFISDQTAAVGMGMTYDSNVVFDTCDFTNNADGTFGTSWKLGSLYAHTASINAISGGNLTVKNCKMKYPEDAYSKVVIQDLYGSHMTYQEI